MARLEEACLCPELLRTLGRARALARHILGARRRRKR
jgi:hypothetical protein